MSNGVRIAREVSREVGATCLCFHTQRAARALARRFDAAFRPVGLNNGQFSMLMALNRPAAPSMAELADTLLMDRTTLTAKLKPLVERGLVTVEADPNDRRTKRIRLTGEGQAVLTKALPIWIREHDRLEAEAINADAAFDPDRLRADLAAVYRQA